MHFSISRPSPVPLEAILPPSSVIANRPQKPSSLGFCRVDKQKRQKYNILCQNQAYRPRVKQGRVTRHRGIKADIYSQSRVKAGKMV